MRHLKHRHQLGVKKEHRLALMGNLASALFTHGRIETTLAKAKALRPFAEKVITLAVKAARTDDTAKKVHLRRLAVAKVRDKAAVGKLFDERAQEFLGRQGGYTRIYKLMPRRGDAAPMALIELIDAGDEGYRKRPRKKAKKQGAPATAAAAGESGATAEAPAGEAAPAEPQAAAEGAPEAGESKTAETAEPAEADESPTEPEAGEEKKG